MPGIGAWESQTHGESIVIAIPHVGIVTFDWAVQLRILQSPVPFTIIANRGLPIDRARCDLVTQAKRTGASHIFFLDSDVTLPPEGLARLWQWRLPIVCGVYGSKHEAPGVWIQQSPTGQCRYAPVLPEVLDSQPLFTHPDIVVGAGCCLIDLRVFDRIEQPYFLWTQGREEDGVSEDFYFFEKVRKLGIPIHVDPAVKCKHIDFCALDWTGKRERLNL